MSESTFYSHAPVVRRESGPFARFIDLSGGVGTYGVVTFSHDIVWLRESEVGAVLRDAHGEVLKSGPTYNDFYGYLTSLDDAIEDAVAMAQQYAVTVDGPLSVEVVLRVEELPAIVEPKDRFDSVYREKYKGIPDDWCRPDDAAFVARAAAKSWDERVGLDLPSYLRRRTFLEAPLWSSRNSLRSADQTEIRDAVLRKALAGLPDDVADELRERLQLAPTPPTGSEPAERGA